MVGIRWKDWKTIPILRPRKRASASSSSPVRLSPATVTVPVSGRSSPAMTIRSVDLPDPDAPTIPTASPRPILRSMSLRIWTRAAPRPSDRFTPPRRMPAVRAKPEVSFMQEMIRFAPRAAPRAAAGRRDNDRRARSYGTWLALVQIVVLVVLLGAGRAQTQANRPVTIVALGDWLHAGFNLPASAAFPAKLEKALKAKGHNVDVINAGVSGDTAAGGLARLDWSVPET